jgi:hypothetical protein
MATTILTGVHDTIDINQDRRVVDMSNKIALLEPSKTPLTVLLQKLRKKKVINPEYKWLEDELIPRTATVSGAQTAGELTINVQTNEGNYFRVGDIVVHTASGETMLVTAVAASIITVTRSYGATAASALSDNDELLIIGNASTEGATLPTIKTTKTTTVTNYTQIFRTPFGATRTEHQSDLYGGSDRNYLRMKKGITHMRDIERSFWFGEKREDTSGSTPRRTTGGALEFISTNVTNLASAGLTETTFEDFTRSVFRYGSDTKFLFCSPLTISKINEFARGKLELIPTDQTFGIKIHRYLSGHGVLNLVRTVLFEGQTYDEYAVCLDLENVQMRVMQDTILKQNVQANDEDGWKDEYLTEAGFMLELEKTHGLLTNVGGAAVT